MTLETFFEKFDQFADAPDALPKMRELVLDLAVNGKLTDRDLEKESVASEYSDEPSSDILPANWRLLNFGKFCDIQGGNQPPKSHFSDEPRPGYVRMFQIRDLGERPVPVYISKESTNRFCREGEILIGRYGASVGKVFWAQDGAYNVALAKFIFPEDALLPAFAFWVLKSEFFQAEIAGASRSAQAGFNKGDLAAIDFPLPPLAEQKRIVAKVDELMALCDRLEAQQQEREAQAGQLARASLARFADAPTPANLNLLFHSSFPISPSDLRKSILTLAVQGKLVPQDPNDEPAEEFLTTVRNAARASGYRGRSNSEDDSNQKFLAHVPDELPAGWSVCPLEDLFKFIDYRGRTPVRRSSGVRLITAKNVKKGFISNEPVEFIADDVYPKWMTRGFPKKGDLLFVTEGHTMGFVGTLNFDFKYALAQRTIDLQPFCDGYGPFYLYYLLSEPFQTAVVSNTTGSAAQGVKAAKLKRIRVIIPPLAEQRRIVAKVSELMALVDELETQLAASRAAGEKLLTALVAELTGANS